MAKYVEVEEVGIGGFAKVCKCYREEDNAIVAKKTLMNNDSDSMRRFLKEARLLSTLNHSNIIKLLDLSFDHRIIESLKPHTSSIDHSDISHHTIRVNGKLEPEYIASNATKPYTSFSRQVITFFKDIRPVTKKPCYIIMPYYQYSLESFMETEYFKKNKNDNVKKIYTSILDAMRFAHKQSIIHRDLHPKNILLRSVNDVVVSDFGIGRDISSLTSRITSTGDSFGVFPFVAPEQRLDMKRAGKTADVYSLGMLLFYLYTKRTSPVVQMSIPDRVFKVILRSIDDNPTSRFKDAGELYDMCGKALRKIII